MRGPSEWFESMAEVVGRLTDRWVKAGALAANEYRLAPRPTTDADLLVSWHDSLISTLEAAGYQPMRIHASPPDNPHLLMVRNPEVGDVDVIIATEEYQELAISRGMSKHCLTVEDVLIHKLLAWRPRDRGDVADILAGRPQLDVDYIEYWARQWEILDNWYFAAGPQVEPP